jgi:hypothetical protein
VSHVELPLSFLPTETPLNPLPNFVVDLINIPFLTTWTIFQLTKVVKMCIQSKLLPYKLIGDATYSMRPWIYCPFKEEGDLTLEEYKAN